MLWSLRQLINPFTKWRSSPTDGTSLSHSALPHVFRSSCETGESFVNRGFDSERKLNRTERLSEAHILSRTCLGYSSSRGLQNWMEVLFPEDTHPSSFPFIVHPINRDCDKIKLTVWLVNINSQFILRREGGNDCEWVSWTYVRAWAILPFHSRFSKLDEVFPELVRPSSFLFVVHNQQTGLW